MYLTLYTYKNNSSLLAPWVVVGYLINNSDINNKDLDRVIPKEPYIYNYRKNINKFQSFFNFDNLFMYAINSYDINSNGDYSIFLANKKIIAGAKSLLKEGESLTINRCEYPKQWYERLACLYAVHVKDRYLLSWSYDDIDYVKLDRDLKEHLNLIAGFKYLPPTYITHKCLLHFENVDPKPYWFIKEIDYINTLI
jgi:hypothetical protein